MDLKTIWSYVNNERGMADWDWLIPTVNLYNAIQAGGMAGQTREAAQQSLGQRAQEMDEYLQQWRAMRPYREMAGQGIVQRAETQPFYAGTWGRYGNVTPPTFPGPKAPTGA